MLNINKISTKYLKKISLYFKKNSVTVIFGPSGSGKSSLLKTLVGLIPYSEGTVTWDSSPITSKNTGLVLQESTLFSGISLMDNLLIPQLILNNIPILDAIDRTLNYLNYFSLLNLFTKDDIYSRVDDISFFDKYDFLGKIKWKKSESEISGGQKQRICLIRALLMNPDLLLLDEPTSALDKKNIALFKKLINNDKKLTLIITTHDLEFAKSIGNFFVFMKYGRVIEFGSNILNEPFTDELKDFLKS